MKAIVVGATGAVGKDLVNKLLSDDYFSEVSIFIRKDIALNHPKLKKHIIHFDNVSQWENLVQGDVLFSCLGSTKKAAGSNENLWKIDYEYQYNFAKSAKKNGVKQLVLVSAIGANPKSMIFYSQMKGKLEEAIKELNFNSFNSMQPSILIRKNSDRTNEELTASILQFLNKLGIFKKYQPMTTETLAQAMIQSVKSQTSGVKTFSVKEIIELGKAIN